MKPFFRINQRALILSLVIAIAVGVLRAWLGYQIRPFLGNGGGDFSFATLLAHDIWRGHDPYGYQMGPDSVMYPLPAGILAMPFALFEDEIASGLFLGLSSFILAMCLLREGKRWPLLVFLSWPFAYSVLFGQWTPLILAMWFLPALMPLILVKPQIALPLVLTGKISKTGVALTLLLLAASLLVYPRWPFAWFAQTGNYRGLPPLLSLPLGPLLFLALFKYRDRRAWLLVLLALMPQRVLYDQLPLLLIATSGIEMGFLLFCSWLTLPVLLTSGGWTNAPFGWQFWIVLTLYIPALMVLLWSDALKVWRSVYQRKFTERVQDSALSVDESGVESENRPQVS